MNPAPEKAPSKVPVTLFLFLTGFYCALIQIPLGIDAVGFGSPYEAANVARTLAATGAFQDPFGIPTGPTAHVAPLYPFLLALLIRSLRRPSAIVWGAILLNAVFMAMVAALLPVLSQRIYRRSGPGIAAGILVAASGRLMPQWEVALAALLLIAATLTLLDQGPVRSGLWAGVSLVTNPSSLLVLILLAARRGRRFAALALVIAVAICTPWILRNWMVMGSPYFVRDNFGLELYISNNDHAASALIDNQALWTEHPNQNREEAAVVARMGEPAYNRMRLEDAMVWIRSHPSRFLRLTVGLAWNYWWPSPREGWTAYGAWLITALGLVGAWLTRDHPKSLLITAAAVMYSLPFLLIQTVGRYRYPSLWASALLAGYGACRILDAVRDRAGDGFKSRMPSLLQPEQE